MTDTVEDRFERKLDRAEAIATEAIITKYPGSPRYFTKRVARFGRRWEVWYHHNGDPDPDSGAVAWRAVNLRFWRWRNAARAAMALRRQTLTGYDIGHAQAIRQIAAHEYPTDDTGED